MGLLKLYHNQRILTPSFNPLNACRWLKAPRSSTVWWYLFTKSRRDSCSSWFIPIEGIRAPPGSSPSIPSYCPLGLPLLGTAQLTLGTSAHIPLYFLVVAYSTILGLVPLVSMGTPYTSELVLAPTHPSCHWNTQYAPASHFSWSIWGRKNRNLLGLRYPWSWLIAEILHLALSSSSKAFSCPRSHPSPALTCVPHPPILKHGHDCVQLFDLALTRHYAGAVWAHFHQYSLLGHQFSDLA